MLAFFTKQVQFADWGANSQETAQQAGLHIRMRRIQVLREQAGLRAENQERTTCKKWTTSGLFMLIADLSSPASGGRPGAPDPGGPLADGTSGAGLRAGLVRERQPDCMAARESGHYLGAGRETVSLAAHLHPRSTLCRVTRAKDRRAASQPYSLAEHRAQPIWRGDLLRALTEIPWRSLRMDRWCGENRS
jgi:hypothetical protein